jgi:hypothetical protein
VIGAAIGAGLAAVLQALVTLLRGQAGRIAPRPPAEGDLSPTA